MKKIILTFIIAIIVSILWIIPVNAEEPSLLIETTPSIEYQMDLTKDELSILITEYNQIKESHLKIKEELLKIHPPNFIVLKEIDKQIEIVDIYLAFYQLEYDKIIALELEEIWEQKRLQYPAATYVWEKLKFYGYNDYVCAGIMGNLMAEVGGQTLNLEYEKYSSEAKGYYGICQWSKTYSEVWYSDLQTQVQFLSRTILYELDTYGFKYKKGFDYVGFCDLTNEKEAALAFAKCYERCGKASYNQRQINATAAYNYFVEHNHD